ncbi:leucine--tRNA ligase [Candidatus Micrarchaeota archaeon]|nr:leucine--tRNA ligase [Candidatus Micrarchaeota archaeon]
MDYASVERKWQDRWFGEKVFEPDDNGGKKFFFTVPYPYVSGPLHVGHGRTYTAGDVIVRFKRMQGYNVLWPMAFHITGTPVLAVSAKIAAGDQDTIGLYRDYVSVYENPADVDKLVSSFKEPWNVVNYFSKRLVFDFKRMGFSLDLSRRFTTGDKEYNKFVEWQFTNFRKKGYLTQGVYPVLYCVKDENAVGEDDIKDGDSDPVEVQHFIAFKFAFGDSFLVSSTLRPETVFGITNMFVNPSAKYVKASVGDETWIVSEQAVEKLKLQNRTVRVMEEVPAVQLVGNTCTTPLGEEVPIFPADFVDPDHASGLVHSVPAHAPFDYVALEQLKKTEWKEEVERLELKQVIEIEGYSNAPARDLVDKAKIQSLKDKKLDKLTAQLYKEEYYRGKMLNSIKVFGGMTVTDAKDKVAEWLKNTGKADDFYEASRKAQCRCSGEVRVALLPDQWFIDYNAPGWKEQSLKCLKRMWVYPEAYKKQFEDVFAWLNKRPCARRRGLGTKLPFNKDWIIESLSDSTIYMAFYTVIKRIRELGVKPEELTPEFFDYVFLGKGNGDEKAASVRKSFLAWYPNDQRHTAIAHITNHLSFFIFAHTAIFEERHWPKAITLNELVISEGQKMSKSKGNVISLDDIAGNHGADLFRLYSVSSAELGATLDFRANDVDSLRKRLSRLYSLWDGMLSCGNAKPCDTPLTRWALSKFAGVLKRSTLFIQDMRLREYALSAFFEALNMHEHLIERGSREEQEFVFIQTLPKWVALLSPVIPHSAEEYWEKLGNKRMVSLSAWPSAPQEWFSPQAEIQEDFLRSVMEDVQIILRLVKKKPARITLVCADGQKLVKLKSLLKASRPEEIKEDSFMANYAKKHFFELREKQWVADESKALEHAGPFLAKRFNAEIVIEREATSQNPKKEKALPGKPAVYVE